MILDPTRQPTFTGKRIDPLHMGVEDVCIEDIAHHLSLVCRYNGAIPHHYSVGQHSVLVANALMLAGATPRTELAGLLHDASEAYINDVTTPVKKADLSEGYRALEWKIMRLVEAVFGLPYSLTEADIVKWADHQTTEREWVAWIEPNGEPWAPGLEPLTPAQVEDRFLERFRCLKTAVGATTATLSS